jgi:alpha-1,3-rhamnosyl/mannosyltransferase
VTLELLVNAQSLEPGSSATGTGTYVSGLLGALAGLDDLDVAALCAPGVALPAGIRRVTVHRLAHRLRAQVMENSLRLPLELRRHRHHGGLYHSLSFHPVPAVRSPWVQTLHDVIPLAYPSPDLVALRRRWRRLAPRYRKADAVIAVSRHAADDGMRHLGLRAERIHVAPHGVDPSFVPGPRPADPPYLLTVGEFSHRKGLAKAFALIDELADAGYPHRLLVVGRDHGAGQPALLRAACRHPERIELRGMVPDVVPLYQGATALIMTSAYEGFGLPVLEAMACGVPVVAFANSAVTEVMGPVGLLVADGDVDAMIAAVCRILDSQELALDLRAQGLARAAEFTWARSAALHLDVYRSVAGHS